MNARPAKYSDSISLKVESESSPSFTVPIILQFQLNSYVSQGPTSASEHTKAPENAANTFQNARDHFEKAAEHNRLKLENQKIVEEHQRLVMKHEAQADEHEFKAIGYILNMVT